ncbi:MAG: NACHT domain-containing protein, partial [Acidobacteria bacterium]|nr:NACHT domain-containing protein [Acidobacteriota bacterium]
MASTQERETAARRSRLVLAFIKEAAGEQLKQIPVVGPLISGGLEVIQRLSDENASREADAVLERLAAGQQNIAADVEQLQHDLAVLTALSVASFSLQGELREWMATRADSSDRVLAPAELSQYGMQTALVAHNRRVALEWQYADHRGIAGGASVAHVASLPLDEVYVEPVLLAEAASSEIGERERDLLRLLLDRDKLSGEEYARCVEEYAALTGRRWRPGQYSAQAAVVGKALGPVRHAVVLGSPGVGKSAMTRYLARTCGLGAEAVWQRLGWEHAPIPVLVPLAAYADARAQESGLGVRQFLEQILEKRGGEVLAAAVGRELDEGRALVLLDGVDEVPDYTVRSRIVQAVDQFLADHPTNRCIVTSRPHGYLRLAGEIPHFQLSNFSREQVETFVCRWQAAFERKRHPDAPDLDHARAEANALLAELQRNPKVAELATNPLMLVIISLLRYEHARLPQQRVQLYNRAVRTLLETWNVWRSQLAGAGEVDGTELSPERLISVWGEVAEWTRRTKPTGIMHRAELKRELVRILRDQELDEDDPEATAESYLRAATQRAGLLEERGAEVFAFWHATFEEFLAAVTLATPTAKAAERLLPLRDDPRWHESVLLAVGYIGIVHHDAETATELVRAIAEQDSGPLEPVLHSHLRLAAACVADDVGVRQGLADQLIASLAATLQEQPYEQLCQVFIDTVSALPRLRPSSKTVSKLAKLVTNPNWHVRMEIARLCANVTNDNHQARELCKQLLTDDNRDVACHAALGLARAGSVDSTVCKALSNYDSSYAHIESTVRQIINNLPDQAYAEFQQLLHSKQSMQRLEASK